MSGKLITLEEWAQSQYGDNAPRQNTLRLWCREGRIYPVPQKHGRSYFVEPSARYVRDFNDPAFMGRMHDAAQTQ